MKHININIPVLPEVADNIWESRVRYAFYGCIEKATTKHYGDFCLRTMGLPEMISLAEFAKKNGWTFENALKDMIYKYVGASK